MTASEFTTSIEESSSDVPVETTNFEETLSREADESMFLLRRALAAGNDLEDIEKYVKETRARLEFLESRVEREKDRT